MKTTTIVNKENVLLTLEGEYNESIHRKLTGIISNIASSYKKTNVLLSVDDLKQEAWCKIFEVINSKREKNQEVEINYLIRVAQNAILAYCERQSNRSKHNDDFACMLMSSSDGSGEGSHYNPLNVAKAKLEYEISKNQPDDYKNLEIQISLENILEQLSDEYIKNLLLIRYKKEFHGTSEKINKLFEDFKNGDIKYFDLVHYDLWDVQGGKARTEIMDELTDDVWCWVFEELENRIKEKHPDVKVDYWGDWDEGPFEVITK